MLPTGWTSNGSIATSLDPISGGIIDICLGNNEWFVIPQNDDIRVMDGFKTRDEAFAALAHAVGNLTCTQ